MNYLNLLIPKDDTDHYNMSYEEQHRTLGLIIQQPMRYINMTGGYTHVNKKGVYNITRNGFINQ